MAVVTLQLGCASLLVVWARHQQWWTRDSIMPVWIDDKPDYGARVYFGAQDSQLVKLSRSGPCGDTFLIYPHDHLVVEVDKPIKYIGPLALFAPDIDGDDQNGIGAALDGSEPEGFDAELQLPGGAILFNIPAETGHNIARVRLGPEE